MAGKTMLWRPLTEAPFFKDLKSRLAAGERGICLTGLVEGSRALVLTLAAAATRKSLLLVLPDDNTVEAYRRDLAAVATLAGRDPRRILTFPALDADPYDAIAPHPEVVRERVVVLGRVQRGEADIVILPARALLNLLPSAKDWAELVRTIRPGDTLPPDRFILRAMGRGYRRVDIVNTPGDISRRGGIVDIFPPNADEPVRIELFGDSVESLRAFDTDHQRSTGQLDEVVIDPATENPPNDKALKRLAKHLDAGQDAVALRQLRDLLDTLGDEGYWPGFEALAALTAERPVTLLDHAEEFVVVVDEPELAEHELARALHDLTVSYEQSNNKILPPPDRLFADPLEVRNRLRDATVTLQELAGAASSSNGSVLKIDCRAARTYSSRMQELAEDLREARNLSTRTLCVMRASGSADRLKEILAGFDLEASSLAGEVPADNGGIFVGVGGLRSGFDFPDVGLSVLTERDLFGEKRKKADRKPRHKHAAFISDFRDLKEGDLVVHIDHGIARYAGLGRPRGGSLNRDFMVLEFAAADRLFVPTDRLELVQKYSGAGGKKPSLDKLGSPGWERVKAKVRKSVQVLARDLLELYARRKTATGHVFPADTAWQQELEAAFPYELTPDQTRAMKEIKRDMQSERPTDRLLVGDVGFGKTEVAVRAAFKAVNDGFQVAVLAPTTVLAAQHFETFCERYAPFPVRVEMASRFRSAAETRKVLEDTALGSVDVLIGTHRLLSKDVSFHRLGLLVVDEEQRFGVAHKEKLKKMTIGVDVISMTATPIPRTLQMSLAGVRDLSIIETPPPGRMAIQTYLTTFRKNVITQAVRQEVRRKGQVFVVHNRVQTLPALARAIQEMVPEARVAVAHGQMNERKLEAVMLKFVNGEADVLVTTTIIENGLDIPRANTIIVNRADRFGLAQLYQLRGRVGRSHEHAYAYFIVPSRQHLSREARQRLKALQEFSDLGAGFRLAAADLEIRGAGELLGSKQSGQIASIGFDLYCQMLERAVNEMKGEPEEEQRPVGLHIGIDIKIPQHYLPDAGDRLVIYKRLAQARTPMDMDRLRAETEDRYGHLPTGAQNLFAMGHLRLIAVEAGVRSIDLAEDRLHIRFYDRPPIEPERILELVSRGSGTLSPSGVLALPAPPRGVDRIQAVNEVLRTMLGQSAA